MYYITHKKREVQTMAEAYNKACRSNAVELLCILQRQKREPFGCAEPQFKLLQEEFKLMREGNEQDILEYMSYFQPSLDAFNILVEMNKKNCIQAYLEKWDVWLKRRFGAVFFIKHIALRFKLWHNRYVLAIMKEE